MSVQFPPGEHLRFPRLNHCRHVDNVRPSYREARAELLGPPAPAPLQTQLCVVDFGIGQIRFVTYILGIYFV
ncbi:hypothetical protein Q5P01_002723 [Channa striata]|uniref:Uncharacterized protein n=1 Tax=Channa striata TaxID=64152 RepID=A0AA88NRJ5_CHASR|nr:hypothetical protein Q5P01_002723 [Channa striata]